MYRLDAMRLEYDEAFSVQAGFQDFVGLIRMLATSEPHPPFFYGLIHVWYPVAGPTELALRYPTVVFNVLTVALLIRLAFSLGWGDAGLVGGALLALNPYQVWYSQEVRMYTPVACFGLLAAYLALRARRTGRRRDLVAYATAMLLALFTHYYAIYLAIFLGVLVGADARLDRRSALRFRRWVVVEAAVAALYLPWLAYAYRVSLYYIRASPSSVNLVGVVKNSLAFYSLGRTIDPDLGARLALGFLAVVVVGLLAARWRGAGPAGFRVAFLAGYLLFPLVAGFLVSLVRSMFAPNYLMVSAPAFFLALGLGIVALSRLLLPLGVVALAYLGATQAYSLHNYFTDPHYNKGELGDAIVYVEEHLRPGDAIVLDGRGQETQFWYYHTVRFDSSAPAYLFPPDGEDPWSRMPAALDQILERQSGIWLLDYGVEEWDRDRLVERYLAANAFPSIYQPIGKNRVLYEATTPSTAPATTPVGLSCDGAFALDDVRVYDGVAPPGAIVPVALDWRDLQPTSRRYVVSWRLRDSAGHVVSQRDAEPVSGFAPTNTWKAGQTVVDRYGWLVPSDLPPGRFPLEVTVYDQASGRPCTWSGSKTVDPGAPLGVGTIQVTDDPPADTGDEPRPRYPLAASAGNLSLIGYDLDPGPYAPGQVASPRLYWRVDGAVSADLDLQASVRDSAGNVIQTTRVPLGPSDYLTSRWLPGRIVATSLDLTVPARATSGSYTLSLQLVSPSGRATPLGGRIPLAVAARERSFTVLAIGHPLPASFAGLIGLLGFDQTPAPGTTLRPGQRLSLTLYWQDQVELPNSYKVFTHLVGGDGKIYGQQDGIPLGGAAPTNGWVRGEVLSDRYDLAITPNAPPGVYRLEVGFYDPDTGMRLPLQGHGGDSLIIGEVRVGEG